MYKENTQYKNCTKKVHTPSSKDWVCHQLVAFFICYISSYGLTYSKVLVSLTKLPQPI